MFFSSLDIFGCFLSILFVYLFFMKQKVIAVVANDVEHTVMITLQHEHGYFYANWFTFVFKVVVMSINGCNIANYWVFNF